MLAVSRLGGFVELLPLPRWVWHPRSRAPPAAPPQGLPDLAASSHTTAFFTAQHHADVMALDAQRTRGAGPAAEFVLAACGQASSEGGAPSQGAAI